MWVLESAHRLSRSLFFGGEEDPASSATGATGGVQEVPEQQQGHGEHGETHGPQHTDEHSTQQEAVLGPQPEQAREHPEEYVIQRGQETARDAQLEAKEPGREPDQERVEEPGAGLVPGQEQLQAPSDLRGVSARERVLGGEGRGPAASSDSPFDEVPLSVDQDAVATGQAHPEGSLQCQSRTLPDTPVGSVGSPIAHSSHRERGESQPPEGAAGRTRSGIALQSDGTDGPDTRRQVAHLLWPPVPPPPPPPPPTSPPPPPPPSSARPSVSAMTWPPAAGSSEDADEAEQGTSTRYATDGSDDERDERATDADSEGGSESGGGGLDGGGPEDILDGGREDTLLPPRRAGVGTSRVSALRQVLLAQASPFALRAAMWRGPEVEPLLDQSARQGLGEGPNADADNRADKAVQIDGAVPTRERHPQLIEDLKAFLGEKGHTKQVEPEEPISHLASPFHAKSPEQARRTVAEAMSSHDSGGQGLELRGLGHLGHVAAGPLGDSAATAAECAPRAATATTAAAGTSSLGDGQAEYRRHSVCSAHGHTSGATSMEDKCLECCVYYGVMCCQCTIL